MGANGGTCFGPVQGALPEGGVMLRIIQLTSCALRVFLLPLLFLQVGCNPDEPSDPGPPYQAQVLVTKAAASESDVPRLSLEPKTLSLMTSLKNLEGPYFKIVFGGELSITDIIGSQISNPRFKGGRAPLLRYEIVDGVVVPRDYTTLALLSAFYQYEQIFSSLQDLTGLSKDQVLADSGRMEVLFEPSISIRSGGLSAQFIQKLNAAYIPGVKQFVLFRRSAIENVPLSLNQQVVAHEFGHALFELGFYQNKFGRCNLDQQQFVIRGVNEGFADIVSWSATGSADVLRNSLSIDEIADPRNFSAVAFDYRGLIEDNARESDDKACRGSIYCIGTLFASSVLQAHKALGKSNDETSRRATMKMVYDSLKGTRAAIDTANTSVARTASSMLEGEDCDFSMDEQLDERDDALMSAFLSAFASQASAEWRPALCQSFAATFGSQGFDPEGRSGVCP
jgi:hypothetical protein